MEFLLCIQPCAWQMTEMTEDECAFREEEFKNKEPQMLVPNTRGTKQALIQGLSRANMQAMSLCRVWRLGKGLNVSLTLFYILLKNSVLNKKSSVILEEIVSSISVLSIQFQYEILKCIIAPT